MSMIRIWVDERANIPQVVRVVRPATGAGIADIRTAIEAGRPIYQAELFLNDFADVADRLRDIVRGLQAIDARFTIREFDDEIEPEVLFNILEGSERYG